MLSTWGGNQTSLDILIKPNAIQNVTRVFKRDNISYDVVIEDLQRMINIENPPLDENELELQDRRGSYSLETFLKIHVHQFSKGSYRFVAARAYNFWRYRAHPRRIGFMNAYMGYNSLDLPMEYWPSANWGSLLEFGTESN